MKHGLPQTADERIRQPQAGHSDVDKAILYGSRAKGCQHPGSDIDLTLLGENLNHGSLTRIANELDELLLPWQIDLSLHSSLTHPPLLDHIDRVGVVLYDKCSPAA
ncbi:MAG: nucleotidyltransferase domain-containing protein [Luteolibacter sp.]